MGEQTKCGAAGSPLPERLENLTEHNVALVCQPPMGGQAAGESAGLPVMYVPPDGRSARVDDSAARIGVHLLSTEAGLVTLTRMRRSGRLVDLPAPRPGTRYVVSRVTALAARDRADLVFPFGEIRDGGGRVTAVRGLAAFRAQGTIWRRLRERRAAAWERTARQPLSKQWLTGLMFAVATALLSGTLSLIPGALDNEKSSGWAAAWATWTLRLAVVFGVVGLILIFVAAWRWKKRGAVRAARGTAYVIEEQAITWRHEEKTSVLADVAGGFAAVLRVPGPQELGDDWHWEAGARTAPQWDTRVDELVRSFWAVHYNDDKITRNAVFVWAPWPVAMAFGARATARRRGLVLHVRQRPSYGAGGPHRRPRLTDDAHDFLRDERLQPLADAAACHQPVLMHQRLTLTIKSLGPPYPRCPGCRGLPRVRRPGGHAGSAGLLLLVVRVTHGPIGPIPLDLAKAQPFTLGISPSLAGQVIPAGTHTIPAAEWRLGARHADAARVPDLRWQAFPAAAEAIADWVIAQTAAHSGRVVLLAMRVPQELAVGLGVQLGQRSWERKPGQRWPERVYPLFHAADRLVVPDLRLGADSVPGHRT